AVQIPIAGCVLYLSSGELQADPLNTAINSGEEYELLFTVRPEDRERLFDLSGSLGVTFTEIGEIVEARGLQLETEGALEAIGPSGFEHMI
ncbi:MAG TPA: hypothetical protein VFQ92_01545, partial [Blastocatellia bacterium]|nr:hypothetical protein [Blastocatellia bacterium]